MPSDPEIAVLTHEGCEDWTVPVPPGSSPEEVAEQWPGWSLKPEQPDPMASVAELLAAQQAHNEAEAAQQAAAGGPEPVEADEPAPETDDEPAPEPSPTPHPKPGAGDGDTTKES